MSNPYIEKQKIEDKRAYVSIKNDKHTNLIDVQAWLNSISLEIEDMLEKPDTFVEDLNWTYYE